LSDHLSSLFCLAEEKGGKEKRGGGALSIIQIMSAWIPVAIFGVSKEKGFSASVFPRKWEKREEGKKEAFLLALVRKGGSFFEVI